MSTPIEVSDSACIVCFKGIEIYSVGECDHPVCFECSTRMRVLCLQTECPICRADISKVIFSHSREPFKKLNTQPFKNALFERKFKICFMDDEIKDAYHKMLEHQCRKCDDSLEPFNTFGALKDHLRKEHDLFFCDLCVENLKIFTNERKFYTRQQLGHHRRKGDLDDTSHKGHPLCEFCDQRYMDTDELYRHLRKDHLYCHLCDADGFHQFYGSYGAMREHFRRDHYLCEEEECGEQKVTGVFRTDIDLRAHKAMEHGKGLSKQAARQARTLELQFTLTPRLSRPPPHQHHSMFNRPEQEPVYEPVYEEPLMMAAPSPSIDMGSTTQFPTLGGEGGPAAPLPGVGRPAHLRQSAGALVRTQQNFPSLAGEGAGPPPSQPPAQSAGPSFRVNITHQSSAPGPSSALIRTNAKPNVSIQVHNRPQSSGNPFRITETSNKQLAMKLADKQQLQETSKKFMDEFPSLSKKDRSLLMDNHYTSYTPPNTTNLAKKMSAPPAPAPAVAVVAPVRAPPPPTLEAFPALSSAGPAPAQPHWITPRAREPPAPKPSKVVAAPQPPLSSPAEFPSLKSKSKKKNDKAVPAPILRAEEPTTNINNNIVKKDKKKNKNETTERPPETAPPDFASKIKINEKQTTKNITEIKPKKNIAPAPTFETSKDKKNANLKNGHVQEKKEKERSSEPKTKPAENKSSPKESPTASLEDQFPSLSMVKKPPAFKMAKTKQPPPGFTKPATVPPPGFSNFHRSVPPCNGFTFTSSSGQNYNIPAHNYVQPIDFNDRNKSLVAKFMEVLTSPESFNEFKQLSQMFREGTFSSESYYKHCVKCLGKSFDEVFPELLALLPDISRQQELHAVYAAQKSEAMDMCQTCGQVMTEDDVKRHQSFHSMQSNFPALGAPVAPGH